VKHGLAMEMNNGNVLEVVWTTMRKARLEEARIRETEEN
jgi:hypothetical protein